MLIPIVAGGGPYVPTKPEIMNKMILLANITQEDTVIDLGSGDGRLVIAAAKAGAKKSVGYEIHPGLTRLSNYKIRMNGYKDRAYVLNKSMWKADLQDVTVVLLYQIPYAMDRMGKMLEEQLPSNARIISHAFEIPNWKPVKIDGNILCYQMTK